MKLDTKTDPGYIDAYKRNLTQLVKLAYCAEVERKAKVDPQALLDLIDHVNQATKICHRPLSEYERNRLTDKLRSVIHSVTMS